MDQYRYYSVLSMNNIPQPLTSSSANNDQQQDNTTRQNRLTHRRCHGNRKSRRFRKKCRQQGMNEQDIQQLIQHQQQDPQDVRMNETMNIEVHPPMTTAITIESTNKSISKKRKRLLNSTSIPSIVSRTSKKRKKKHKKINILIQKFHHRLPSYLKKASNILSQSLSLQLQQKLTNNKKQQQFLHYRLQLLDQQQRIEQQQYLWRSYLNLGSSCNLWPVS